MVSDLNKTFGGSTDLAKKRHGSADLAKKRHGSADLAKKGTDRRICIPLFTPLIVVLAVAVKCIVYPLYNKQSK